MQRFLSFLQSKTVLDGKFIETIKNSVRKLRLDQNDHLYIENQSINHIYFLLDGLACSTEKVEGQEVMTSFWESMEFVLPPSRARQNHFETTANVQVFKDSKVLRINVQDIFDSLQHPKGRYLYNHFIHVEFRKQRSLAHCLRTCKVKDRVKYLNEHHPSLFHHLNHEQLASFIGTSRPNLSNLLAELVKGG